MYPILTVDLNKIRNNARRMSELCAGYGISITGITKSMCGEPRIAEAMMAGGIKALGDSQLANLKKLEGLCDERWMIRIPSIREAESLVLNSEVSLESQLETLSVVNQFALKHGKKHKVVLMKDMGDLREGIFLESDFYAAVKEIKKLHGLELYGIGTNLTCLSFVQPDTKKISELVKISKKAGLENPVVSFGNSATLSLMMSGGVPEGANNLRLGESVMLGRERAGYSYIEGTENDGFILQAEIVEIEEKPSMPIGKIGVDSYGRRPEFVNRGIRKRAICACGRQSIDTETMWTMDRGTELIGASSDHMIVDITDANSNYAVGDFIEFRLGYFAIMRGFTSPFIERKFIDLSE